MADWRRSTVELEACQAEPRFMDALQRHIERFGLDLRVDDCIAGVMTTSQKRGLFRQRTQRHVFLRTPVWLAVVFEDDQADVVALTIKLKEAEIEQLPDIPAARKFLEQGLPVRGLYTGRVGMHGSAATSNYLPLGDEPVARSFRETLIEAIRAAKP